MNEQSLEDFVVFLSQKVSFLMGRLKFVLKEGDPRVMVLSFLVPPITIVDVLAGRDLIRSKTFLLPENFRSESLNFGWSSSIEVRRSLFASRSKMLTFLVFVEGS